MKCPCQSGKRYAACCEPFHKGKIPEKAEELMRSRYAAYALGLVSYIVETTHPNSPQRRADKARWEEEIRLFSASTVFKGLEILDVSEGLSQAAVTFRAELEQGGRDVSFTEKSSFERVGGKWLYKDALLIK